MPSGEVIALPPFFQEESTQFTDLDPCLVVPVPFGCSPLCSMDESQQYNLRSCIDPFTYTGYDPELFQPLSQSYPNLIDQEVVDWFKKEHICCKSTFHINIINFFFPVKPAAVFIPLKPLVKHV